MSFPIEEQPWWNQANERRQALVTQKHTGATLTPDQEEEYKLLQAIAEVIVNGEWRTPTPCCPHPKERHTKSLLMSSTETLEGLCMDCRCTKYMRTQDWPGYRG